MPDDVCGICGNDWPRQFMILLTYDEFAGWCTVGAVEEPLYNIQMVYYCLECWDKKHRISAGGG